MRSASPVAELVGRRLASAVLIVSAAACGHREPDLRIRLPNGYGVEERTAVRYMGVDVGNVTAIRFAPNGVVFEVALRRRDVPLREGDSIRIGDRGLLGGGGTIDIFPGPATARPVLPGGTLVGRAQPADDGARALELAVAAARQACPPAPGSAAAHGASSGPASPSPARKPR